jgi:hypothetical protein
MPPILNGNARGVHFTTSDLKWLAFQQKAIAIRSKTEDVRSVRPDRVCFLRGRSLFHVRSAPQTEDMASLFQSRAFRQAV